MSVEPFGAPSRTYLIGHLAREFGVTIRTLRYYEELGLLSPDRQEGGRQYSARDRARLILILQGRAVGMPLAEIGTLLKLFELIKGRVAQRADALATFQRQLRLLEARRKAAEQGIALLQSAIEQLTQTEQGQVSTHRKTGQAARGEQLRGAAA